MTTLRTIETGLFGALLFGFAAFPFHSGGQSDEKSGATIAGWVSDAFDGFAVEGAYVILDGTTYDVTDSWGYFNVDGVPIEPLTVDFTADSLTGIAPLTVNFTSATQGGMPLLEIRHANYHPWEDQILIEEGGTSVIYPWVKPVSKMRITCRWNYNVYMNEVDAYLNTPSIEGQFYSINSINPPGSMYEPPFAIFKEEAIVDDKLIFLHFQDIYTGTYKYFLNIDKYGVGWGFDMPVVKIYDADSLIQIITTSVIGEGDWWYVCDMDGATGGVTVIDEWLEDPPPSEIIPFSGHAVAEEYKANRIARDLTYHWDFGDGATSGEQNPTHVYDEPGIYQVSLTASDGFEEATEIKSGYIQVGGAGIDGHRETAARVFPNPVKDHLRVIFPASVQLSGTRMEWRIFDLRGTVVRTGQSAINGDRASEAITVSGMAPGMYRVEINAGDRVVAIAAFVLMK